MKTVIDYRPITDLRDPELNIYTSQKESQLKHYYEPAPGLFICESPKVIRRALQAGFCPESFLLDAEGLSESNRDILEMCGGVPVYTAPSAILSKLTGYHLTAGMLCAMRRKPLPPAAQICGKADRIAVLEDIENPTNIGAVFRSAAALQMDAVLLTAGCSDPLYRRAARVSMGTVFQIPWTFLEPSEEHYIGLLHARGFQTAAMALNDDAISIRDPRLKRISKLAVILGNEDGGLLPETLEKSDYIVKIPMADGVDSLNAAAAGAVAFWELARNSR